MQSKKLKLRCKNCKTIYLRYRANNRPQRFCSRNCYLGSSENSETQRRRTIGMKAEKNLAWKGDDVTYKGLHRWIEIQLGQAKNYICYHCDGRSGSKKMNWSNTDHKYTRDLSKWLPVCKICHSIYDQKHFKTYSKS